MKTYRKAGGWLALGAALVAAPLAGRAQSDLGQNYVQLGHDLLGVSMMNSAIAAGTSSRGGSSESHSATYDYHPTPALAQQTVQRLVGQVKAASPASAQAIANVFAPGKLNYEQAYHELNNGNGLRENNLADILATYWLLGYLVVNNVQDSRAISQQAAQWTSINLVPALAKTPQFRQPATAAQVGEEFKLQAVLLKLGWEEAIKNNTLAAYRQQTATNFRQKFNIDFTQLKITDRGLAKK